MTIRGESNRLAETIESLIHESSDPFDSSKKVVSLALVREAVATLGWGTMTYACDKCRFEWKVWLALGVEGPPALREAKLYVPSPFYSGTCPAWPGMQTCDGQMSHVRFPDDEEFPPRLIPDDAPRFVLDDWHDCARLSIPVPALVAARRFHNQADGAA